MSGNNTYLLDLNGIEVEVTRKRVRNVNFRIGPHGEARMSVPMHMGREQVARTAWDYRDWFLSHQHAAARRVSKGPVNWETSESLDVWGQPRILRVEECESVPSCFLTDGELAISVPRGSTASGRGAFVEKWLKELLRQRVGELQPAYELRMGVKARSITYRRMKSRWGSCTHSTQRIRLNTALAECPEACLEMVLVHELCHLAVPNHGPRFKALMDLYRPDWRVTQRWLNEHAPRV